MYVLYTENNTTAIINVYNISNRTKSVCISTVNSSPGCDRVPFTKECQNVCSVDV